jgi:hypothetical protein
MKRTTAILLALVAAIVDALAALSYSDSLPLGNLPALPIAGGGHIAAVVLCMLAISRFRPSPDKATKGSPTLMLLAAVLTAVAPIAGPLAIAVLILGFTPPANDSSTADQIVIGNPLRRPPASKKRPSTPLVDSVLHADVQALRQAGPSLHRQLCPAAVNALRSLQVHSDPRTQLHSQGGLTALNATVERQLEKLRSGASGGGAAPSAHRNLASLLHHAATSRLHDSIDSDALLNEAIGQLHQALSDSPNDLESLQLLARCQLQRGNLRALPAILTNLRAQPDSDAVYTAVEVEYNAAQGRWHSASRGSEQLAVRSSASQDFWQGLRPFASV